MRPIAWVLVAACSGAGSGPTTSVVVMAGTQPAAGATVLSHRADGSGIDGVSADALGHAELATEPDALISMIFPAVLQPSTDQIEVVTTPAVATGDLVIVGPPAPRV